MKKAHMKMALSITLVFALVLTMPLSAIFVSAQDSNKTLDGKVYEFSKKNDYEIDDDNYEDKTSNVTTLGKLTISGSIHDANSKNGRKAFVVDDDKNLKIEYTCNDKYLDADKDEWHLTDDGGDEVNGIELDDDIDIETLEFNSQKNVFFGYEAVKKETRQSRR